MTFLLGAPPPESKSWVRACAMTVVFGIRAAPNLINSSEDNVPMNQYLIIHRILWTATRQAKNGFTYYILINMYCPLLKFIRLHHNSYRSTERKKKFPAKNRNPPRSIAQQRQGEKPKPQPEKGHLSRLQCRLSPFSVPQNFGTRARAHTVAAPSNGGRLYSRLISLESERETTMRAGRRPDFNNVSRRIFLIIW